MNSSDPRPAPQRLVAGAVDLTALSQPRPAASASSAAQQGGGPSVAVVDVTEANFQSEVLERSMTTPVVIDFWAEWCEPCKQLSPVLEKLAVEGNGAWVLAKIDVDANPQLAQAFQVQGIPMVIALADGRPVDGFQGVQPEAALRQWLAKLLEGAGVQPPEPAADAEPEDPHMTAADAALEAGDYAAAEREYQTYLDKNPGDSEAESGLAHIRLMRRLDDADLETTLAAAASDPGDVDAACVAADAEVVSGRAEAAYERLITLIGRTAGADREKLRKHLLELFAIAAADDPSVVAARRKLSAVLF